MSEMQNWSLAQLGSFFLDQYDEHIRDDDNMSLLEEAAKLVTDEIVRRVGADKYGDQRAKRSGVLYMNHIDEGLIILDRLGADQFIKGAFCLHPIFQDDVTLVDNASVYSRLVDQVVLVLVMEYRNVANRGLSCYQVDRPDKIYLSPMEGVNVMLVADKVQNRKDFLRYHYGKHEKSIELDIYFKNWLRALGITEARYNELVDGL